MFSILKLLFLLPPFMQKRSIEVFPHLLSKIIEILLNSIAFFIFLTSFFMESNLHQNLFSIFIIWLTLAISLPLLISFLIPPIEFIILFISSTSIFFILPLLPIIIRVIFIFSFILPYPPFIFCFSSPITHNLHRLPLLKLIHFPHPQTLQFVNSSYLTFIIVYFDWRNQMHLC